MKISIWLLKSSFPEIPMITTSPTSLPLPTTSSPRSWKLGRRKKEEEEWGSNQWRWRRWCTRCRRFSRKWCPASGRIFRPRSTTRSPRTGSAPLSSSLLSSASACKSFNDLRIEINSRLVLDLTWKVVDFDLVGFSVAIWCRYVKNYQEKEKLQHSARAAKIDA